MLLAASVRRVHTNRALQQSQQSTMSSTPRRRGHESRWPRPDRLFGPELASADASWPRQTSSRSSSSQMPALPPGCSSRTFHTALPWSCTGTMAPSRRLSSAMNNRLASTVARAPNFLQTMRLVSCSTAKPSNITTSLSGRAANLMAQNLEEKKELDPGQSPVCPQHTDPFESQIRSSL